MPKWVAQRVNAYKRMDGSTGYEFHGMVKAIDMLPGDIITKEGRRMHVEKECRPFGSKKLPRAVRQTGQTD